MKRLWGFAVPALVLIIGAAGAYALTFLEGRPEVETVVEAPVINITVMELAPQARLEDRLVLKGSVAPWATIRLSAETPGRVDKITVHEGDAIKPGEAVVYLEADLLEAAHAQAQAQAELDVREVERLVSAKGGGAATEMEVDRVRSAAAVSKAVADHAAARLRRAVIHAPTSVHDSPNGSDSVGRLNDITVELGEYVLDGHQVAEIVNTSTVRVIVDVPERDIRHIRVDQEVTVVIEALDVDGLAVHGTIHFISAVADPLTRTYRVEVKVANPDGEIRPGMFAKVSLLRKVLENVIMIPLEAVIPLETDYEVYISDGERAHRRVVSLRGAVIIGDRVEARPPIDEAELGLKPGDRLIVQGQRLLGEGQRVREQEAVESQLAPDENATTQPAADMAVSE